MMTTLNLTHDQINALLITPVLLIVSTACIIALIWAISNSDWWE